MLQKKYPVIKYGIFTGVNLDNLRGSKFEWFYQRLNLRLLMVLYTSYIRDCSKYEAIPEN